MRTYGKLRFAHQGQQGEWLLEAVPSVVHRIKHALPQIEPTRTAGLILTDTLDNAADLDMIVHRWPLIMSTKTRDVLTGRLADHARHAAQVDKILRGKHRRKASKRTVLREPREYQYAASDLMLQTGALLVVDSFGLGKSFTGLLALRQTNTTPMLIVTESHLPPQWAEELELSFADVSHHIVTKATPYDINKRCGGNDPDVIIMNWAKLAGWRWELAEVIKSVVYDEAQNLRRTDSARYQAAAHISSEADYVMGLTATPVYNYGNEIFNVLDAMSRGCLGTPREFDLAWGQTTRMGNLLRDGKGTAVVANPEALKSHLHESGLMIRRTRSGVGLELPEVSRSTIDIDADPAGFDDIAVEVVALAQSLVNPETLSSDRWRISGEFDWRLRRATGVAKAAYVAEFVRMVIETGEPVLLGGWHHDVYEIWADKLKDLNPAFFTGKETPKQKEATKQAFLNGDTDLMIMSLRSGAGTDGLQKRASTVVFGELDWSPAVHDQFIGRLNRDGAIAPVQAFFMVSGQGADPAMVEVLQLKRQQAEALVGTETGTATQKPITQQARIRALAESFLATRGNPPAAQPSTPPLPPVVAAASGSLIPVSTNGQPATVIQFPLDRIKP